MRQQHDQLQEEYANAEQAAQQGFSGLNPEVDKEALAIHKQFMDQTKAAADELATKGFIDSGRRRSLLKLKSIYTNQVAPLQQQIALRASRNEELRKMQLQDPTFRATANPNQVSLVSGLKNPNAFDYDGVSGNQLYSTAAKKLEQLSKTINQDVPELKKMPKLSFQYFTAIQSGATPDQAANAMKREGYDPAVVDKMTNMIHGTIDSTMREFGVYDKFKGNDKAINELWDSTSQAAYNAIGTKQFGQVHDSWSEGNERLAQQQAKPAALAGKSHQEFDASFNDEEISKVDKLLKDTKATREPNKMTQDMFYRARGASNGTIKGTYDDYLKSFKDKENLAQKELFKQGVRLGVIKQGDRFLTKDIESVNEKIASKIKEQYKDLNKTHFYYNTKAESQQKFESYLAGMEDIKDFNGKKIDKSLIFSNSGGLNKPAVFKFGKNGPVLQVTTKDGENKNTPFDMDKIGNPKLSEYYRILTAAKNYSGNDFKKYFNTDASKKEYTEGLMSWINNILAGELYSQIETVGVQPGLYQ